MAEVGAGGGVGGGAWLSFCLLTAELLMTVVILIFRQFAFVC